MASQQRPRTLILDTSVLVHDPYAIEGFPDDTIVISPWVIDELDHLKRSEGERGEHARHASRIIDEYCVSGQLRDGIALKNGGVLISESEYDLPSGVESTADNKTIFLAKRMKLGTPQDDIIVISKDINLRIKASMFGVRSGDYEGEGSAHDPYALFPGCTEIVLATRNPLDELHRYGWIDDEVLARECTIHIDTLIPNQCVYLLYAEKHALAIYEKKQSRFRLVKKPQPNSKDEKSLTRGVRPVNCEQAFAYSLLMNPDIDLVALIGSAGSGKTLMSLLAARDQLRSKYEDGGELSDQSGRVSYNQIIVFRPNIEIGEPLGFLPGTVEEKFEPWMYPIFDNLHLIMDYSDPRDKRSKQHDPVRSLIDFGMLEIQPINHIRGRSFHHKFIIIDEAQNLTRHQVKSLITRSGQGTKVVLTGDLGQIDLPYVDQRSNGLSHVVARFIGQEIFGYTIMKKGEERSLLAKLGSDLL